MFLSDLEIIDRFSYKSPKSNLTETRLQGGVVIHAGSRADITNLIGAFNDYATPLKKTIPNMKALTLNLLLFFLITAIFKGLDSLCYLLITQEKRARILKPTCT
jgi:hypothetical protein